MNVTSHRAMCDELAALHGQIAELLARESNLLDSIAPVRLLLFALAIGLAAYAVQPAQPGWLPPLIAVIATGLLVASVLWYLGRLKSRRLDLAVDAALAEVALS